MSRGSLRIMTLSLLLSLISSYSFAETPVVRIKSDVLEYSAGIYTATGDVTILQEGRRLTASTVILDSNTGEATAYGHVEFADGNNTLSSEGLKINLHTSYARIDQGRIFIKEDNYHIEGDAIERLSEDRFRIGKAAFTTCDGERPCWRFRGKNINIHLNHILTAESVSFAVKDIPVLYLPYIALPILQERQTGLLIPRVGYNTGEGLKINNAFFWAIADNQDATLYGDYYGKKGWGSGLEYRYLFSHDTGGQFKGYYIEDIQVDKSRWDIKYHHRQTLSEDASARLRINYLNDKTLYKDISEDIGERLQRSQDSDLYVNKRWDALSMHLWGQYTQNLSGKNDGIFQRVPEAGLRVMDTQAGRLPVYWGLASSASRWEETHTGLTRLYVEPRISARFFETTGFTLIPEAGAEQVFYYIDGEKETVRTSRYNLAATVSTKIYKPFTTGSGHLEHFIEPALRYEYAEGSLKGTLPFPDPDTFLFPPFTKGGIRGDYLTERNLVSFSLINRIVSTVNDERYEPLYLRLTQMYKIDSAPSVSPDSGFSDLRLEAIIRLKKGVSIDTDATYNYSEHAVISAGTDVNFRGDSAHLILGQRYTREAPVIRFLTASAGIRLYQADVSMDFWYDHEDHIMREADYALKYGFQCWGVTFSYRYKPEEEQFNFLLTLKGLGSVGGQ